METEKAVELPKDPKSELFSDAESDELNEELDALITDKQYHDFVYDIAHNKDVVDDEHDRDYEPSEDGAKVLAKENVDEGIAEENEEGLEVANVSDSSSASSLSGDEEEHRSAADGDADGDTELKIPMEMLKETEKRFPPFWRTKQALKNFEGSSYKSEDDLDYVPEEDEDASQEDPDEPLQEVPQQVHDHVEEINEAVEYREGEADEDTDEEEAENEMEIKQEIEELVNDQQKPIQQDVDNLVSMVEMLTLPPENSAAEEVDDSDSDAMEEDVANEERPENILSFDADGYNSAEDPDFVPDEKEAVDVDSAATSSDDESSDEVEKME